MTEIYLRPSDISFTHDKIKAQFTNGKILTDVFDDLLNGNLEPENMEKMHVVFHKNNYYIVAGNRRLCLFKMTLMQLSPRDIHFTHNCIKGHFSNRYIRGRCYRGRRLVDVFEDLLYGNLNPDDMGPIHVVYKWGKFYAVQGNRRLRLFKTLDRIKRILITVKQQPVIEDIFHEKYSTENDGKWVDCDDPYLRDDIKNVIQEWRESESVPYNYNYAVAAPFYAVYAYQNPWSWRN